MEITPVFATTSQTSTSASTEPGPMQLEGRKEGIKSEKSLERLRPKRTASSASRILGEIFRSPRVVSPPETTLRPEIDENDKLRVSTEDGYTLTFQGKRQEWTINTPNNTTTTIWGDPHVVEGDGDTWDFLETSTFYFGNNRAIIETVPAFNGKTYTRMVTLINGEDQFKVTDIDIDRPKIVSWSLNRSNQDPESPDSVKYRLLFETNGSERWERIE